MHLLVIGGTVFLGRHIVLQALAAGHKVTTLNRGKHTLPEQDAVEKLIDDREMDLDVLTGRHFDAVIDTCGYKPEVVKHSAEVLKNAVQSYIFVSTISVYGEFYKRGLNETDAIKYTQTGEAGNYGTLKADCEKALLDLIPDKTLIVRPGLIVGPYDPTDRFTYWPARIAKGGKILAPGDPASAVQFIDVRDLSKWIIELAENKTRGVFNATGPKERLSMRDFLETSKSALRSDCQFVWIDEDTLEKEKVQPFADLPLWIPASSADYAGFLEIDCSKAFDAGLHLRPIAQTVKHTVSWDNDRDPTAPRAVGLSAEREWELVNGQ
ncbi:MAG: NAD-dependent epimerase/dehydratase family protein [Candidatus Melainabacteria bacterium]|nr:NAD-dependent epimerase/dehydratase family protein [Candidatus Melainabacteria bacterium]